MTHKFQKKTMLERFEEKYKVSPNGCWEWTGAKHGRGYGYFYTSKEYSQRKMDYAHRVSLFLYKGERDDEQSVLHSCDNTCCVNPDHLSLGSHKDNMRDMSEKGRHVIPTQVLSKEQVLEAMQMRQDGMMVKDIAEHFGISPSQMSRVTRGLTHGV